MTGSAVISDMVNDGNLKNYIVCGYFTPDYKPFAKKLSENLYNLDIPFHLFAIEKVPGGWEANTMAKPNMVYKAIKLYPTVTVIFLDVDAEVKTDLSPLTTLKGDIAAAIMAKRKNRGNPKMFIRTGTLVIQPTSAAHTFVTTWKDEASQGKPWDIDQTAFALALSKSSDLSFQPLAATWCARERETKEAPSILQGSAGVATSSFKRLLSKWHLTGDHSHLHS